MKIGSINDYKIIHVEHREKKSSLVAFSVNGKVSLVVPQFLEIMNI